MNDPGHPHQPSEIPGVPPPPPKINTRRLWITLLAPPLAMVVVMLVMFFARNSWGDDETFITGSCGFACIVAAISWGVFIHTLAQRFHGTSLILLILAYPLLQAVLLFAIFFTGCLAIISSHGY